MSPSTISNAWSLFNNDEKIPYADLQIESLIRNDSKASQSKLKRYIYFDIMLKSVVLILLLVTTLLFMETGYALVLGLTFIIGVSLTLYQLSLVKKLPAVDFNKSCTEFVGDMLTIRRSRTSTLAILTGFTNPLLILTGSYLYFFNKYGAELQQSGEDIIVSAVLMFVGFLIGYLTISGQQHQELNDLEISQQVLLTNDNSGLKRIAKRRRRRFILTLGSVIVGFVLFLWLIMRYINWL